MNKRLFVFGVVLISVLIIAHPGVTRAQMMGNGGTTTNQTSQDELEGKAIFDKLQSKQVSCANLNDDDFDVLGDYYMGAMMGSSHDSMNTMMQQRLGEDNERLMHIAMGKRLSACDPSAPYPQGGKSFLPMMAGFTSANGGTQNGNFNSMMGFGGAGWVPMVLWLFLLIVGGVFLFRVATNRSCGRLNGHDKTAMDILKQRFAKGEIDKKDFEEKKKDIGA